jgi:hypothetical protein
MIGITSLLSLNKYKLESDLRIQELRFDYEVDILSIVLFFELRKACCKYLLSNI